MEKKIFNIKRIIVGFYILSCCSCIGKNLHITHHMKIPDKIKAEMTHDIFFSKEMKKEFEKLNKNLENLDKKLDRLPKWLK